MLHLHRYSRESPVIPVRVQRDMNFLDRISKKHSNIKFHENPYRVSRVVLCGRTDGQTNRGTWRSQ